MARISLPIGPNLLKYTTPSGITLSQTINLVGGYNVVYIRMFRDKAAVLTSNDPKAVPPVFNVFRPSEKVLLSTPVLVNEDASISAPVSVSQEPTPAVAKASFFEGLKSLVGISTQTKPEEPATMVTKPPELIQDPNLVPSNTPSSSNMDAISGYEAPNLLDRFQQLFK
jgi:hypothetical protein